MLRYYCQLELIGTCIEVRTGSRQVEHMRSSLHKIRSNSRCRARRQIKSTRYTGDQRTMLAVHYSLRASRMAPYKLSPTKCSDSFARLRQDVALYRSKMRSLVCKSFCKRGRSKIFLYEKLPALTNFCALNCGRTSQRGT